MIIKINFTEDWIEYRISNRINWVKKIKDDKIKDRWRSELKYIGYCQVYKGNERHNPYNRVYSYLFDVDYNDRKIHRYLELEKLALTYIRNYKIRNVIRK